MQKCNWLKLFLFPTRAHYSVVPKPLSNSLFLCKLLLQNQTIQQMLTEMEGVRVDLKMKDEEMCARETVLEQARTEGELTCASLKRVKQDLTREMTQCKTLEGRMGQISPANELFPDDNSEGGGEVEELRSRPREHMEAVQSLWKEQEAKKTEYESHVARLEPREREMNQMRSEFAAQRSWLVGRLEEMYEIFTGREKPVSTLKFKYHHVYTTINLTYFNFQVPKGEGDTNHPYI